MRDERAYTLVEMLVTVWILGAVMTSICAALLTMANSSNLNRKLTLAETELRAYAEAIRSTPYVPCEDASGGPDGGGGFMNPGFNAYNSAYATSDTTGQVTISPIQSISYWDETLDNGTTKTFAPATFVNASTLNNHTADPSTYPSNYPQTAACDVSGTNPIWDFGVQQMTIQVVVAGTPTISQSQVVIKRDSGAAT